MSCCTASKHILLSSLIGLLMATLGLALPASDETHIIEKEHLLCVSVNLQLLAETHRKLVWLTTRSRPYVEVFPAMDGFDMKQTELYKGYVARVIINQCVDYIAGAVAWTPYVREGEEHLEVGVTFLVSRSTPWVEYMDYWGHLGVCWVGPYVPRYVMCISLMIMT